MTDNKTLHFNIKFEDLTFEKQEEIIAQLTPALQEAAKAEGQEFLKRTWYNPQPTTWQEAYVRTYELEYTLWQEEVANGKIITPGFIWETYQESHVEELARKKAEEGFNLSEIEISI